MVGLGALGIDCCAGGSTQAAGACKDSCHGLDVFCSGAGEAEVASIAATFRCHSSHAKLASRKVLNPVCLPFENSETCASHSSQL